SILTPLTPVMPIELPPVTVTPAPIVVVLEPARVIVEFVLMLVLLNGTASGAKSILNPLIFTAPVAITLVPLVCTVPAVLPPFKVKVLPALMVVVLFVTLLNPPSVRLLPLVIVTPPPALPDLIAVTATPLPTVSFDLLVIVTLPAVAVTLVASAKLMAPAEVLPMVTFVPDTVPLSSSVVAPGVLMATVPAPIR